MKKLEIYLITTIIILTDTLERIFNPSRYTGLLLFQKFRKMGSKFEFWHVINDVTFFTASKFLNPFTI